MKRPDRGAKSYVGGVSSSSAPRGRKDRGQGRSSRVGTRAIHIRLRFSCLHLSFLDLSIHPPFSPNHTPRPRPGSPCSLPSLTKRHSHSPSRISFQNPLHQIALQIQIYFFQRVFPPNPHHLLLDGPSPPVPLVKFNEISFSQICPNSRSNNAFFVHTSSTRPCRRATCLPLRLALFVLPPHVNVLRAQPAFVAPPLTCPKATIHHCVSLYQPLSQLKSNVELASPVAALRIGPMLHAPSCCSALPFHSALYCHQTLSPTTIPVQPVFCLYIEDPFIRFGLPQARKVCLVGSMLPSTPQLEIIPAND